MSLSIVERQDVLDFIGVNQVELVNFVGPDAEEAHREDGFMELTLVASLFLSFLISLRDISKAAMSIGELWNHAMKLVRWCKQSSSTRSASPEPSLREKLLVILFESYASKNVGLTEERLHYFCGGSRVDLDAALNEMMSQGIARKTRHGSWRFVRR